ncbi:MAG: UbiA family prenyltransferase [Methanobacteriota archaeon]|nr:MAG: UbiA family prenyltransferase [Euryarchaeota archaeon]
MVYLRLIRPINCALAAVGVLVASIVTVGTGISEQSLLLPVLLACLAAALVTAAGNVLNDYSDRNTDKVNHPERPIPSGQITPGNALIYSVILFVIPFPLSYFVNVECMLLVALNVLVLVSYERYFKRRGFAGNLEVSWLTGSIFIFGGLAAYRGDLALFSRTLFLALLAFLATLGREIAKDIQDVSGDVDRNTLPRRVGVKVAAQMAAQSFALAIVFSFVPSLIGILSWVYFPVVMAANIIFIYSTTLLIRNPKGAGDVAKIGMIVALFAFLLGGLL